MSRPMLIGSAIAIAALVTSLASPAAGTSTRAIVSGYAQYQGQLFAQPVGDRSEDSARVQPVEGNGVLDGTGVRMFSRDGKLYNHPVAQAQYALNYLNSYRVTGDSRYLDIAQKNAQRLIDTHVDVDGAWYYPYPFDFPLFGDPSLTLHAPWYSGMAQGRALGLFSRLYQTTHDQIWLTAADATFPSLQLAPSGNAPFAAYVDTNKHLWLEEYPNYPPAKSENALNGHIFAIYGLLDYWQVTNSSPALDLIRGGLATVEATVMTQFRQVNGMCLYSLGHRKLAQKYHQVHVGQFLTLYRYTRDPSFARMALAFRNDYPYTAVSGTLSVTPRTRLIYRATKDGRILQSKQIRFNRNSSAPFDERLRLVKGPVALRASAGTYKGWFFPEIPGVTWALGAADAHTYAPPVSVTVQPGSYTAYKLGSKGNVVATKTVRFSRRSSAPTAHSAIVLGKAAYYFDVGAYAGFWLPIQTGLTF